MSVGLAKRLESQRGELVLFFDSGWHLHVPGLFEGSSFFWALTNGMWRSVAASTSGHYSITFGEKQHRTDAPGIRAPGSTLLFRRGCPARHPCVSRLPNRQRSAHRAGPKPVPERIQQTARQPVNNCFKMTTPILPWPRIRFAISPVCPLSYRSQQWFKMHPTTVSSRRISS